VTKEEALRRCAKLKKALEKKKVTSPSKSDFESTDYESRRRVQAKVLFSPTRTTQKPKKSNIEMELPIPPNADSQGIALSPLKKRASLKLISPAQLERAPLDTSKISPARRVLNFSSSGFRVVDVEPPPEQIETPARASTPKASTPPPAVCKSKVPQKRREKEASGK
jgi:hypothetical protein